MFHHEIIGLAHYNKHLARIIAKAGGTLPKSKVREGLTNEAAIIIEIALIKAIGRGKNGPLVNLTDGGDGKLSYITSKSTKQKIGDSNCGRIHTEKTRALMRASHKNRPPLSDEAKKNKSIGQQNRAPASDITRQKMRDSSAKRWAKKESHDNAKAYFANLSDEDRAARSALISATTKAAMVDPSIRFKISKSRKARGQEWQPSI